MAIIYDPHQRESDNLLPDVKVKKRGTAYTVLIPTDGPFYALSSIVKHKGKELTFGKDYCFGHTYETGILRTGRLVYSSIWVFNKSLSDDFTLTAHYVGMNSASEEQIDKEITAQDKLHPIKRYWEDVVGDVYFPPVDIQFDWHNWQGELELMEAIKSLEFADGRGGDGTEIIYPNKWMESRLKLDTRSDSSFDSKKGVHFLEKGKAFAYLPTLPAGYELDDFELEFSIKLRSMVDDSNQRLIKRTIYAFGQQQWYYGAKNITITLMFYRNMIKHSYNGDSGNGPLLTFDFGLSPIDPALYLKGVDCKIQKKKGVYYTTLSSEGKIFHQLAFDPYDPVKADPSQEYNLKRASVSNLRNKTAIATQSNYDGPGVYELDWITVPGYAKDVPPEDLGVEPITLVIGALTKQIEMLRALYKDAPAHAHIPNKNDPHKDAWGAIGAIEKGGLAYDTKTFNGLTEAQLTDKINSSVPGLDKIKSFLPWDFATGNVVKGPVLTGGGLGWIATKNDDALVQFGEDGAYIGLSNKGNGEITYEGLTSLLMSSQKHTLTFNGTDPIIKWNGQELITEENIGKWLPSGGGGGNSAVLVAQSTPSVTLLGGSGTRFLPFRFKWVEQDPANRDAFALRMVTSEFGNSRDLLASPYLLKETEKASGGRLQNSKAKLNGMWLRDSVPMDKQVIKLSLVENYSDLKLPLSTLQKEAFADKALLGHKHPFTFFNIPVATPTVKGTIRFAKGWVNSKDLALDGGVLKPVAVRTEDIHDQLTGVSASGAINIIRYGDDTEMVIADGLTFNESMITIKENRYFVGKEYVAPNKSFNFKELYPTGEVFVLILVVGPVNGKVDYKLVVDTTPEGEVRPSYDTDINGVSTTEIGWIRANDGIPSEGDVYNVNRMGQFAELIAHKDGETPHFRLDYNLYEVSAGFKDAGWITEGVSASRKNCWTRLMMQDERPCDFIEDDKLYITFNTGSTSNSAKRNTYLSSNTPLFKGSVVTQTFNVDANNRDGGIECGLIWWKTGTQLHRLSVLVYNGGNGNSAIAVGYNSGDADAIVYAVEVDFPAMAGYTWSEMGYYNLEITYGETIDFVLENKSRRVIGRLDLKTGKWVITNPDAKKTVEVDWGKLVPNRPDITEPNATWFNGVGLLGYQNMNAVQQVGYVAFTQTVTGDEIENRYGTGLQYLFSTSPNKEFFVVDAPTIHKRGNNLSMLSEVSKVTRTSTSMDGIRFSPQTPTRSHSRFAINRK